MRSVVHTVILRMLKFTPDVIRRRISHRIPRSLLHPLKSGLRLRWVSEHIFSDASSQLVRIRHSSSKNPNLMLDKVVLI